ncbi:MAG: hypothetical protein FWC40_04035 [Proteobacteria bacterium]|nr:hypothetical protein [Pseudomonadota bacterium]
MKLTIGAIFFTILVASLAPAQAWACFALPDVECKIEYLGKDVTSNRMTVYFNSVDTLEDDLNSAKTRAKADACASVCQMTETQENVAECVENCLASATCIYATRNSCDDDWL